MSQPADHQHIGVVVPARGRGLRANVLETADRRHHVPFIGDVAGRTPQVAAGFGAPVPHVGSPVAHAVDDIPVDLIQRLAHDHVGFLDRLFLGVPFDLQVAAIVVFEVIHAPFGPSPGVGEFMPVAPRIISAGRGPGRGVDAEFESQGVDVVAEAFEIREFFVREEPAVSRTRIRRPSVVDIHIRPSVGQEFFVHGAGGIAHLRVVDREPPAIPAVPAHGRSQGDLRPYFQQYLPFGFPEGILRCQQHPKIPFGGHTARYQARTGIELQPFGKPLRPVRHRAFAAGHDRHQEGIARAGAVYERIVDLRRFGARGGQDIFTLGDRPGPDGQGFHLPARGDPHLQPVGMVVHDPVAGLLDQQQDFVQAGQVDVERTGSIALAHHAAVPQHLPVTGVSRQTGFYRPRPPPRRWRRHRRRARTAYG